MIAIAGVIYCSRLNSATDPANNQVNYAVEKTLDEDLGVLSENAEKGAPDGNDVGDVIDMGDIDTSTEVPLGDVTE